jgi:hypothetical protein
MENISDDNCEMNSMDAPFPDSFIVALCLVALILLIAILISVIRCVKRRQRESVGVTSDIDVFV